MLCACVNSFTSITHNNPIRQYQFTPLYGEETEVQMCSDPCPNKQMAELGFELHPNRVCALDFIILCICHEDTEEARMRGSWWIRSGHFWVGLEGWIGFCQAELGRKSSQQKTKHEQGGICLMKMRIGPTSRGYWKDWMRYYTKHVHTAGRMGSLHTCQV